MYFCIVDTETTGLESSYHEIIELAAIICDRNLKTIATTSFRIAPEHINRAHVRALEINGYDPETWNPEFKYHYEAFNYLNIFINKYIGDDDFTLVGQNVQFDKKFIVEGYKKARVECLLDIPTADLIHMAKIWSSIREVKFKSFSLKALSEFTGIVNENPHAALADVETTLNILRWFVDDFKKDSKHVKRIVSKRSQIKIR